MLSSLCIENYALIERLEFNPEKGLTVITGETGAGKSIIMGALSLILGQRADAKAVRTGSTKCVIEATFDISAGIVTRDVKGKKTTIKARQESNFQFGAIIVPQRLDNRVPLVEVIMKGVSYLFESKFLFKPGVDHLVNLVITDNPEQVKIEVGGEVENWQ